MDNHEKLKTAKIFEITLDSLGRREGPFESIRRTQERWEAGELTKEEIERIREAFASLGKEIKSDQKHFLQSRGFPPDLVQAVRLAMADLFGTFATTEEIEEFAMDKVWDLLQTAYDRRQWLANVGKPPSSGEQEQSWPEDKEATGRLILKRTPSMTVKAFCRELGLGDAVGGMLFHHINGSKPRKRNRN